LVIRSIIDPFLVYKEALISLIQFIQSNSKHHSGIGIVGFCERTEMLDFVGSFAEDHRKNQHFRSEQNKAHRSEIVSNLEICALTTIPQP
jgi:hypothetical protein